MLFHSVISVHVLASFFTCNTISLGKLIHLLEVLLFTKTVNIMLWGLKILNVQSITDNLFWYSYWCFRHFMSWFWTLEGLFGIIK